MVKIDFTAKDFKTFCKKNNLTKKQGAKIVLKRIEELSNQIEEDNENS